MEFELSQTMRLGDRASSEALIHDLYIGLRQRVVKWSAITHQTPQARMGYVGQHLVSIVTGIPGGKSGARGFDLVLPDGRQSEIKTCYRVDQLGTCDACRAVVSSVETECSVCGGLTVTRKDDSKWLIGVKTDADFEEVLVPDRYYFVLFEFNDIKDASDDDIVASIWEVDPMVPGFAYCMVDYKLNIQPQSISAAAFNLWPWSPKFYMMRPTLIYQSVIDTDSVTTRIFPNDPATASAEETVWPDLATFSRSRALTEEAVEEVLVKLGGEASTSKRVNLSRIEDLRGTVSNATLCDLFADAVYRPRIRHHIGNLTPKMQTDLLELNWAES